MADSPMKKLALKVEGKKAKPAKAGRGAFGAGRGSGVAGLIGERGKKGAARSGGIAGASGASGAAAGSGTVSAAGAGAAGMAGGSGAAGAGGVAAGQGAGGGKPRKQPGFLRRAANKWWDRLIGAVFGGQESARSEQYLSHQTTRDYVLNTAGQAAWGALFPLLTMVCTWIVGAEDAGLFSMAFTIGTLLLFLANFGTRTYQVSDIDEMQTFSDYQAHRVLTCAAMMLVRWVFT